MRGLFKTNINTPINFSLLHFERNDNIRTILNDYMFV